MISMEKMSAVCRAACQKVSGRIQPRTKRSGIARPHGSRKAMSLSPHGPQNRVPQNPAQAQITHL